MVDGRLDYMISEVFFNIGDSVILLFYFFSIFAFVIMCFVRFV